MPVGAERHQIELLQQENAELRFQLAEAEEVLHAIRTGEVDALIVGDQVYTLTSAEASSNRVRGEMLAQVNDAIVAVDNDNRVTFLNAATEQQYGVTGPDVLGHKLDLVFQSGSIRPEDAAAEQGALDLYGSWRGEKIHIKRNGEEAAVELSITRLRNHGAEPTGFLMVIRDITQRKAAEQELRRLNEHLEELVVKRTARLEDVVHELDAFASSVSHDLRAPLRAMHGHASALIEDCGPALDESCRQYVQRIIGAAERMDKLIQDLLAYSRLTREEIVLQPLGLDLAVADARHQVEETLSRSAAEVTVDSPLPAVVGHRAVIVQVIANLLTNAVKFVAPGVVPQIRITAEKHDGRVRLWIRDNGIGIEPQYQQRIFNIFERLHSVASYPGTGIGLAIVRKGIERLGGKAGVESKPGMGSSFWIELPSREERE